MTCKSSFPTKWFFTVHDENKLQQLDFIVLLKYPVLSFSKIDYIHGGYYYCYGVDPKLKSHFIAMKRIKVFGI